MSPGCATRVVTEDGGRAFVKAVGAELNPDSPSLFRREIEALGLIGGDPLWASLLASYDDGSWVALLLEDVEGRHADLAVDAEMDSLLAATDRLGERLSTVEVPIQARRDLRGPRVHRRRAGVRPLGGRRGPASPTFRPTWSPTSYDGRRRAPATSPGPCWSRGSRTSPTGTSATTTCWSAPTAPWCSWTGAPARSLRAWGDPLLARLERVDSPWFDASVHTSPALARGRGRRGDRPAARVRLPPGLRARSTAVDVGLPTLNEFRRAESRRILTGAARRLGS